MLISLFQKITYTIFGSKTYHESLKTFERKKIVLQSKNTNQIFRNGNLETVLNKI